MKMWWWWTHFDNDVDTSTEAARVNLASSNIPKPVFSLLYVYLLGSQSILAVGMIWCDEMRWQRKKDNRLRVYTECRKIIFLWCCLCLLVVQSGRWWWFENRTNTWKILLWKIHFIKNRVLAKMLRLNSVHSALIEKMAQFWCIFVFQNSAPIQWCAVVILIRRKVRHTICATNYSYYRPNVMEV